MCEKVRLFNIVGMADYKAKIEKLNNSNYTNWRFKVELMLKKENLWRVITDSEPVLPENSDATATAAHATQLASWTRADEQAFSIIGLSIDDDQIAHIRNETTAVGAWNQLRQYHERATLSNKVHLMREICSLKMRENGNVVDHIGKMQNLFVKLSDICDDQLTESWRVAMLLSSLPASFDTLVTALEAREEDELTFIFVQQKLIGEFERHTNKSGASGSSEKMLKVVQRNKGNIGKCYFCKKANHMKKDCAEYKKWLAKKECSEGTKSNVVKSIQQNNSDCLFGVAERRGNWMLDSGATRHVSKDKRFYSSLDSNFESNIEVANGDKLLVNGIGSGCIQMVNEKGVEYKITATEVLYAPHVTGNVLSVAKITDHGYTVTFNKDNAVISLNGSQKAMADRINNVYELRVSNKVNALTNCHNDKCIHTWHRVLGHRDI